MKLQIFEIVVAKWPSSGLCPPSPILRTGEGKTFRDYRLLPCLLAWEKVADRPDEVSCVLFRSPCETAAGSDQLLRIGLFRLAPPQGFDIEQLDQAALLHDGDAVAQVCDDAEIVAHQDAGELVAAPEP